MQDVTITFIAGPMTGSEAEFEVGEVLIGRMPGTGGLELKHASGSVSRVHAELVENNGELSLKNHSPNGTTVEGKLTLDVVAIHPGAEIQVGDNHTFQVNWVSFNPRSHDGKKDDKSQAPQKPGVLASPVVRSVIGVYMLGMVALAVWEADSGSGNVIGNDWPRLEEAYASYHPEGVSPDVLAQRVIRAQTLVGKLRVFETLGRRDDAQTICREIMSLDSDIQSPLFQYGAACLGSN